MKVINLFAGPGAGKSTCAAKVFYLLKSRGERVELVTEFAKDIVYEGNEALLGNNMAVVAEQFRRLWRLRGQVDYVVTDSPLPLALVYSTPPFDAAWFHEATWSMWRMFDNSSFFIDRVKPYYTYGRRETEHEARQKDDAIRLLLQANGVKYRCIAGDVYAADIICQAV